MKTQQTLRKSDKENASRELFRSSFRLWQLAVLFGVIIVILLIIPQALLYAIIFILPILAILVYSRSRIQRAVSNLPDEQAITMDKMGISIEAEKDNQTIDLSWNDIVHIKETQHYYFMMLPLNKLWFLKKEILSSPEFTEILDAWREKVRIFRGLKRKKGLNNRP